MVKVFFSHPLFCLEILKYKSTEDFFFFLCTASYSVNVFLTLPHVAPPLSSFVPPPLLTVFVSLNLYYTELGL